MPLSYPTDVNTPKKKFAYILRVMEKLKLLHNFFGKWYTEGKTESQWNNLPAKIRTKYPYKAQLTAQDWADFKYNDFERIENMCLNQHAIQKRQLQDDVEFDANIKLEDIDGDDRI